METTHYQQLVGLLSDRAEIADEITRLQQEKQRIEEQIGLLLDPDGTPVRVPGVGSVCLSKPSVVTSFDPGALRELIQSLKETGNSDLAGEIEACTKQSARAGGLRVTAERQRREIE